MTQRNSTRDKTRALDDDLIQRAHAMLSACVGNAESWAVKFVCERSLPNSRTIPLPDLQPATIRTALADGRLTISEAASLSDVMSKLASVEAVMGLEARLEELEMLLLGTPQTIVSGQ